MTLISNLSPQNSKSKLITMVNNSYQWHRRTSISLNINPKKIMLKRRKIKMMIKILRMKWTLKFKEGIMRENSSS